MAESKDFYTVLEIKKTADSSEIKKSYQKLAKQFHPDKLSADLNESEQVAAIKRFHEISQAYEVLSNKEQRHIYDTKTNEHQLTQKWPITATLDLDDMTFDPDGSCFSSSCRCGGSYTISESEMEKGVDIVCCSTCTLGVRVLYQAVEEDD